MSVVVITRCASRSPTLRDPAWREAFAPRIARRPRGEDDEWTEIIDLTRQAQKKSEWHAYDISGLGYLRLERDAVIVHDDELSSVPGLLQTEDYMRTLFQNSRRRLTDAEIDLDVRARLFRQRRLTEEPALELIAIVDEFVLRRPVGGTEVMRAQLRHLLAASDLPSVCLHVLPASLGVHSGMDSSFTVLGFGDPDEPEIAYFEHVASSLHLHKEADVTAGKLVFDQLRSEALSPRDSVALIERLAAENLTRRAPGPASSPEPHGQARSRVRSVRRVRQQSCSPSFRQLCCRTRQQESRSRTT